MRRRFRLRRETPFFIESHRFEEERRRHPTDSGRQRVSRLAAKVGCYAVSRRIAAKVGCYAVSRRIAAKVGCYAVSRAVSHELLPIQLGV